MRVFKHCVSIGHFENKAVAPIKADRLNKPNAISRRRLQEKMRTPRKLDENEAQAMVVKILRDEGPMTTIQIEERMQKRGEECPDSVVLFLSKLRLKGVIKGKVSQEHRGWLWWVE